MVGMISDIGNYRKLNEDFVGSMKKNDFKCYIVADGMGGHNAGEVASSIAVKTIIEIFNSKEKINIENVDSLIKEAIDEVNDKIFNIAKENENLRGMGTTITLAFVQGKSMNVANIGDSSCFVLKNEKIEKITKDHSLVQELIDSGSITEEQAKNHPNKNIITRALGTHENVEVDLFKVSLEDVDKVILCTDGLSNVITDEDMIRILDKKECSEDQCRELVELSKIKGSRDNISVIVFEGACGNEGNYTRD